MNKRDINMDNKKCKFLFTLDRDMSNKLKNNGFTMLSDCFDRYIFLNDGIITFDKEEAKKITYTNILCM